MRLWIGGTLREVEEVFYHPHPGQFPEIGMRFKGGNPGEQIVLSGGPGVVAATAVVLVGAMLNTDDNGKVAEMLREMADLLPKEPGLPQSSAPADGCPSWGRWARQGRSRSCARSASTAEDAYGRSSCLAL